LGCCFRIDHLAIQNAWAYSEPGHPPGPTARPTQ
jgi:hypothetical protein